MLDTPMDLMIRFARPAFVAIAFQVAASAEDFGLATKPALPVPPPAAEGPVIKVIEVQYSGPATYPEEEILGSMTTAVGTHYSEQVVASDVPAIYKTGRIHNLRIFGQALADGVKIYVVVQYRPKITEIRIQGATAEIESALRNDLGARTGDLFDGSVLASDRQRIIDYCRQPGKEPVDVEYAVDIDDDLGVAKIIFSIHDGHEERIETPPAPEITGRDLQRPESPDNPSLDFLTPVLYAELSEKSERTLLRRIAALESAAADHPENQAAWLQLGAAYVQLGTGYARVEKAPQAVDAFRKAVRLLPGDAAAWQDLAACLFKKGSLEEALSASGHAVKADSASFDGWIIHGFLLTKVRRLPEAKAAFEKAKALEPKSKILWAFAAFLHLAEGRIEDFSTAAAENLKMNPDNNLRWSAQSVAAHAVQDYPRSLEALWTALETAPEDQSLRVEMLARLLDDRFWDEAWDETKKFIDQDLSDNCAWAILGWIDAKREHWKEGVEEIKKAQSLGFDSPASSMTLSRALIELGRLEDAKKILAGFATATPKNAEALGLLGVISRKEKRLAESNAYSNQALEIAPENPFALLNLASNCLEMKRLSEAIQYAQRVRDDDPEKWRASALIGSAQEQLGHPRAAADAFKEVTSLKPERFVGWEGLARLSNDYDEACNAARKAAELDGETAAAQALLGITQARFGKNAEAIDSLISVLAHFPENNIALKTLDKLLNPHDPEEEAAPAPSPASP